MRKFIFIILIFTSFLAESVKDCVFCKIINNELPAEKIFETDEILVIKDKNPQARIHYLILPKRHLENLKFFENEDIELAGSMLLMAKDLSNKIPCAKDFKIIINNGSKADQTVFHSHFHFMAGIKK